MKKLAVLILCVSMFINSNAQNKSKCKLVYDKELKMQVYSNLDSVAEPINQDTFFNYFLSDSANFKGITQKYPKDQMVGFIYSIDIDGKAALVKVLSPKNKDLEIENELIRIIGLMPLYKPCMCGKQRVVCFPHLFMRLYPKEI